MSVVQRGERGDGLGGFVLVLLLLHTRRGVCFGGGDEVARRPDEFPEGGLGEPVAGERLLVGLRTEARGEESDGGRGYDE